MKDPNWSHSGKIYDLRPSLDPGATMSTRPLCILCSDKPGLPIGMLILAP